MQKQLGATQRPAECGSLSQRPIRRTGDDSSLADLETFQEFPWDPWLPERLIALTVANGSGCQLHVPTLSLFLPLSPSSSNAQPFSIDVSISDGLSRNRCRFQYCLCSNDEQSVSVTFSTHENEIARGHDCVECPFRTKRNVSSNFGHLCLISKSLRDCLGWTSFACIMESSITIVYSLTPSAFICLYMSEKYLVKKSNFLFNFGYARQIEKNSFLRFIIKIFRQKYICNVNTF